MSKNKMAKKSPLSVGRINGSLAIPPLSSKRVDSIVNPLKNVMAAIAVQVNIYGRHNFSRGFFFSTLLTTCFLKEKVKLKSKSLFKVVWITSTQNCRLEIETTTRNRN